MISYQVKGGDTDFSVVLRIIDSTDGTPETGVVWNTSGIDLEYRREGAVSVDITEATLAALTTAHTDGGFLHIGNGYYRLDLPDAAVAAGVDGVLVHGTVTGMVVIGCYIRIVAFDPQDAVRLGLTALPNAAADAAGGLPISDAGGLDIDAKLANTNEVTAARMGALTDWINGGRLDLILDIIAVDTTTDIPALIAALNDLSAANVATELATYDGPTKAEMDTAHALLATAAALTTVDTVVDAIKAVTDAIGYEHNSIWIDTVNGAAGTVDYVNGTVDNPVNSIADANTLATSLGISRFEVAPGSSITFAAAQANQVFHGEKWTLALGGQNVAGSVFIGAAVSGVMAGTGVLQFFIDCVMNATSLIKGTIFKRCNIADTMTVVEAGEFMFDQCSSSVAGAGAPTFDFGSALNSSNLNIRHHSGGWTIENMGAGTGTYNASFEGFGQIIWAASCSAASNASIRGHWKITDNAGGAVTETLDDVISDLNAVLTDTNELQTDDIPGLIAALNDLSAAQVNTEADTALTDYDGPTKAEMDTAHALLATAAALTTVDTVVDAIKAVTDLLPNGGALSDLAAILADTNELQVDDVPGLIAALNDLSAANVNAEVVDALATDTIAELTGIADAPATPTHRQAIMLLYMWLRNDSQSTSSERRILNDAGTEIMDAASSDDATTFKQGKLTAP